MILAFLIPSRRVGEASRAIYLTLTRTMNSTIPFYGALRPPTVRAVLLYGGVGKGEMGRVDRWSLCNNNDLHDENENSC